MPRRRDGLMHGQDYRIDRKQGALRAKVVLKAARAAKRAAVAGDCDTARMGLRAVQTNIEAVRKISYRSLQPSVTHRTVARLERLYGRAAAQVRRHCPR